MVETWAPHTSQPLPLVPEGPGGDNKTQPKAEEPWPRSPCVPWHRLAREGASGILPVTCWSSSARVTITPGNLGLQRPERLSGKAVEPLPPKGAWHRVRLKPRAWRGGPAPQSGSPAPAPRLPASEHSSPAPPPGLRLPRPPRAPRPPASHAPGLLVPAPAWVRGPSCAPTRERPRSCSRTPRLCARPGPD